MALSIITIFLKIKVNNLKFLKTQSIVIRIIPRRQMKIKLINRYQQETSKKFSSLAKTKTIQIIRILKWNQNLLNKMIL